MRPAAVRRWETRGRRSSACCTYEPGQPSALIHLARIAAVDKDYRLLDSITRHFDRTDSVGEWRQETHSIQAAVRNDSAGLARAATELADAPDGRILNQAIYAWRITLDPDAPRQLLEPLTSTTRPPEVRAFGYVSLAWLELTAGRLDRAREELARAATLDSVTAIEHGALMLLFPFVPATTEQLTAMREQVSRWTPDRTPNFAASRLGGVHDDAHLVLRDYLLGGLSARLGDGAEAERRAASLDRATGPADLVMYARAAAAGVRAQAAIAAGHLDQAATLLERSLAVQSRVARLGPSAFYPRGLERYHLAESLRALGREAEARQWYNSFYNSIFDAPFVAPAQRRLAELAEHSSTSELSAGPARRGERHLVGSLAAPVATSYVRLRARQRCRSGSPPDRRSPARVHEAGRAGGHPERIVERTVASDRRGTPACVPLSARVAPCPTGLALSSITSRTPPRAASPPRRRSPAPPPSPSPAPASSDPCSARPSSG